MCCTHSHQETETPVEESGYPWVEEEAVAEAGARANSPLTQEHHSARWRAEEVRVAYLMMLV